VSGPTTIQGPTVHYKVSRVNGDSCEEKAQLNKCDSSARLNAGWLSVFLTVPDVRTADRECRLSKLGSCQSYDSSSGCWQSMLTSLRVCHVVSY